MKRSAPVLATLALAAVAAIAVPGALAQSSAAPTPADRLAAPAARPELPMDGDFYRVDKDAEDGPSYMRVLPPVGDGQGEGWLVQVLRKPEQTESGPGDLVAGFFHFDCVADGGEVRSMVLYTAKGATVYRLDRTIEPKFVEDSPIWRLREAACGRPPSDLDRFTGLEAVLADARSH